MPEIGAVNPEIGAINLVTLIVLLSFAIDRAGKTLLYMVGYVPYLRTRLPDPGLLESRADRLHAERKQKLVYFILASILAGSLVYLYEDVRLLKALNVVALDPEFDAVVTGFILIAGSDFLGRILEATGAYGGKTEKSEPIEVTGRLILDYGEKVEPRPKIKIGDDKAS